MITTGNDPMKRLYFLFQNAKHTCLAVTELTKSGIHASHIHAVSNHGPEVTCVQPASLFQTSDLIRGILLGFIVGGLAGLFGGGLVAMYPPPSLAIGMVGLILCGSFGSLLGTIVGGTLAKDRLNPEILPYESAILRGSVLLIIDTPRNKIETITKLVLGFKGMPYAHA